MPSPYASDPENMPPLQSPFPRLVPGRAIDSALSVVPVSKAHLLRQKETNPKNHPSWEDDAKGQHHQQNVNP
jgi:hypothetical protein